MGAHNRFIYQCALIAAKKFIQASFAANNYKWSKDRETLIFEQFPNSISKDHLKKGEFIWV